MENSKTKQIHHHKTSSLISTKNTNNNTIHHRKNVSLSTLYPSESRTSTISPFSSKKQNYKKSLIFSSTVSSFHKINQNFNQNLPNLTQKSQINNKEKEIFDLFVKNKKKSETSNQEQKCLNFIFRKGIKNFKILNNNKENFRLKNKENDKTKTFHQYNSPFNSNNKLPKLKKENFFDPLKNFNDLEKFRHTIISHNIDSMQREINIICSNYFQIIDPMNFSKDFRIVHNLINISKDEEIKRMIENFIEKKFKLTKEVSNIINIQKEERKRERNLEVLKKFKMIIISAAMKMKKLNISLEEFLEKKYVSTIPYQNTGSENLIKAVKDGDIDYITYLLNENKFIVRDFDYFEQTPLHWATKRNFTNIIIKLIKYGAIIDAQDYLRRTPLHIACRNNYIESVKVLLLNLADPAVVNKEGKLPSEVTSSRLIQSYLERARTLHSLYSIIGNAKVSQERIRRGLEFFFNADDVGIPK